MIELDGVRLLIFASHKCAFCVPKYVICLDDAVLGVLVYNSSTTRHHAPPPKNSFSPLKIKVHSDFTRSNQALTPPRNRLTSR